MSVDQEKKGFEKGLLLSLVLVLACAIGFSAGVVTTKDDYERSCQKTGFLTIYGKPYKCEQIEEK